MPSNVLPLHLNQIFPPIIWIFIEGEGDGIESRLPFKIFSTLQIRILLQVEFEPIVYVVMRTWVNFYAVLSSKKNLSKLPPCVVLFIGKVTPGCRSAFLGYRCVSFNIILCGRIKAMKSTIFHAKITESKEEKSVNARSFDFLSSKTVMYNLYLIINTVFPRIFSAETILFWIWK